MKPLGSSLSLGDALASHLAGESLAGYRWQCVRALQWAIRADSGLAVGVETHDDVAILSCGGSLISTYQLKHSYSEGTVAETSPEWWDVVWAWLDSGVHEEADKLVYVSSKSLRLSSPLSSFLKSRSAEDAKALVAAMDEHARKGQNKKHADVHAYWLERLTVTEKERFVTKIEADHEPSRLSEAPRLLEAAVDDFLQSPEHSARVAREVRGWFEGLIDERLGAAGATVTVAEVRAAITTSLAATEYVYAPEPPDEASIAKAIEDDEYVLLGQMRAVELTRDDLRETALTDFFAAVSQRRAWRNEHPLAKADLGRFDTDLLANWTLVRARHAGIDSAVERGQAIYYECMARRSVLKSQMIDGQLSRGSYHYMADRMKLGWHPHFREEPWKH